MVAINNTSSLNLSRRLALKLLGLVGFWLLAFCLLGATKAHAFVSLHPDPAWWGGIPSNQRSALESCDTQTPPVQTPGFAYWISPSGQPSVDSSATTYQASSGQTSFSFEWHVSAAVCYTNSAVTTSADHISNIGVSGGGSVTGINYGSDERILSFNPYNEVGIYATGGTGFTWNAPSSLSAGTHVINITIYGDTINQFTDGSTGCVGGGGNTSGLHAHSECPQGGITFSITINVTAASYTVQGYRINQTNGAPLSCGTAVAGGQASGSNPFNMGPFTGTIQTYSDAPTVTCSGNTYNYTGSDICYNSVVSSAGHCSDGNLASNSTLVPRSPSDPTTRTGGPPYYLDVRFYYQPTNTCPNVPNMSQQINFQYVAGPSTGTWDGPIFYQKFNPQRDYFWRYPYSTAAPGSTVHQIDSISPANSNYYHSDVSGNHGIVLNYSSYFSSNPNTTYQPQINYHYIYTYDGTLYVHNYGTGTTGPSSGDPTIPAIASTTSADSGVKNYSGTVYGPLLGPCNNPIPTLTCTVTQAPGGINQTAIFDASGGSGTFSWSGGGSPPSQTGSRFTTSWSTYGSHTVTVVSGDGQSRTCTVNIPYPPVQCYYAGGLNPYPNQSVTFQALYGNGTFSWKKDGVNAGVSTSSYTTSFSTTGTHTVSVTSGNTATCTVNVVPPPLEPYLRVYGGDVVAGSGLGAACKPTYPLGIASKIPQIIAYNNYPSGPGGSGSATNLAAFALSIITQFTSATGRVSPNVPLPGKGLSFSNTIGDPNFGGNFNTTTPAGGTTLGCANDYTAPSGLTPLPISDVGSAVLNSGSYSMGSAGITSSLPGIGLDSSGHGKKIAIYATGNVFIVGNQIIYANSGSWTSVDQIPSFYLVVRGNIYIDSSVTKLDGVYVALPDPVTNADGVIYTCANTTNTTSPPLYLYKTATLYTPCNNQLVINGSFIAKQVKFQRTHGDIPSSSNAQLYTDTNIAEVFRYGPELWLNGAAAGTSSQTAPKYDAITSLPPIL